MDNPIEIAWAAGLFEGEGCITMRTKNWSSKGYGQARLKLVMTDEDVVRKFSAIIGIGTVRESDREVKRGYKMQWEWCIGSRAGVSAVLELLYPYLGQRRRNRADEILHHIYGTG